MILISFKLDMYLHDAQDERNFKGVCGGQNLSFCTGFKVPFFNNNASEEKKTRGKAP